MRQLLFLWLLAPLGLLAQQATIIGKVISGTDNQPLELATITIKKSSDNSLVVGGKTKQDGSFNINNVDFGSYNITVSAIGFKPKEFNAFKINSNPLNLGNIVLSSSNTSLKGVTVTAERSDIVVTAEKKVFNIEKNATSAGGTAADALRNVPSVNVDMDGSVSIRGKGNVTILVDGKQNAMFESDPETALQALPASSIESIEVITNPSSKYDAQGMNGIINIILKKDRKPGYNGMITLGAGSPYRLNAGLNLNANVKKWNLFLNANGRTSKTWEETSTHRDNYDNDLTYSSYLYNKRRPLNGFVNLGFDYNFDKKNKLTFSSNLFAADMRGDSRNIIENGISYTTVLNTTTRDNTYTGRPVGPSGTLQYKHIFKNPKEEINVELNVSRRRYTRVSNFETNQFDSLGNLSNSFIQKNPVKGGNWNGTFQIDYTKPLFKSGKIDIGTKSYVIDFKSENQPTIQFAQQAEVPETILKNKFKFMQQVHSVYTNVANQYNKTSVQVGLRAEYFYYDGFAYQYNAGAKDDYISLFPTLFVSQKISNHEDLTLNYARRVNRPNFFQLIPYLDVTNPQDTTQGNPALRPEFIHAMELGYTNQYDRNNTFLVSLYYQYTNNLIQRFRRFNEDGTTYSQNRNLASAYTFGLEATNKMNILSWWDATLNVNVFRNQMNGKNVDVSLQRNGFGGFAKLSTNMKFKYDLSAQLTGNYFATTVISQGIVKPYSNVDLALRKSFFKKMMTATINVTDIFNTLQTETVYQLYPEYNQTVLRKNLTRTYGINLQWRIASKSSKGQSDMPKRPQTKSGEKETKNRDENLKKEDGGDDMNGGGNRENK